MSKVRANTSFVASRRRIIHEGDLLDSDDPVVERAGAYFTAVDDVPAKTAAPSRNITQKRGAPKKAAAKRVAD